METPMETQMIRTINTAIARAGIHVRLGAR
jgi:hypothetical protein